MNYNYDYNNDNNSSKQLTFKFWILVILICIFLGFCLFRATSSYQEKNKKIIEKEELGANISLEFENNSNIISLLDYTPTKDYLGKSSSSNGYIDFSVNIHMKQASAVEYEISLQKAKDNTIDDSNIHIYLEKKDSSTNLYQALFEPKSFDSLIKDTDTGSLMGNMLLNHEVVSESRKDEYRIRMWLVDTSLIKEGTYNLEILLEANAN